MCANAVPSDSRRGILRRHPRLRGTQVDLREPSAALSAIASASDRTAVESHGYVMGRSCSAAPNRAVLSWFRASRSPSLHGGRNSGLGLIVIAPTGSAQFGRVSAVPTRVRRTPADPVLVVAHGSRRCGRDGGGQSCVHLRTGYQQSRLLGRLCLFRSRQEGLRLANVVDRCHQAVLWVRSTVSCDLTCCFVSRRADRSGVFSFLMRSGCCLDLVRSIEDRWRGAKHVGASGAEGRTQGASRVAGSGQSVSAQAPRAGTPRGPGPTRTAALVNRVPVHCVIRSI